MLVLGESEKARLQRIFEWNNGCTSIPEPNREHANNNELIRKRLLGQGALRKQKRWLDILASEVVEREIVLKVMRAERQEHLSKDKLRHEIQERIKCMKEIQNNIARQERLQKQSQMAELVDQSMIKSKSCHATYNAQREKNNNKTNEGNRGGLSSHSKRLLEHNLNTSTNKPATNHRRYKHSHNTPNFPIFLPSKGSNAPNFPSFLSPKGCNSIKLVEQSKGNHRHHDQENHHHHKENQRYHVEKRQERDLKTCRHHKTSCGGECEVKTKSRSRP